MQGFEAGKSKQGNINTDGKTIFSYRMPIARVYGVLVYIIKNEHSPSVTTTKHINDVVSFFPETTVVRCSSNFFFGESTNE